MQAPQVLVRPLLHKLLAVHPEPVSVAGVACIVVGPKQGCNGSSCCQWLPEICSMRTARCRCRMSSAVVAARSTSFLVCHSSAVLRLDGWFPEDT